MTPAQNEQRFRQVDNIIERHDMAKLSTSILVVFGLGASAWFSLISADNRGLSPNDEALESFKSRDAENTISAFETASQEVVTNENGIVSLYNIGTAHFSAHETDLALDAFQEALQQATPGTFTYFFLAGEIADLQNDPLEALANYKRAYDIYPGNVLINQRMAQFYLDEAAQCLG